MKRISSRAVRFFLLVILSSAAACGCAYRVGSSLSSRGKSICVDNFVNKTTKPQIEFETTSATARLQVEDGIPATLSPGEPQATVNAPQKVVEKLSGLTGQTTFAVTVDLLSDEKTALPAAAKDLAHHIVEGVVEYW